MRILILLPGLFISLTMNAQNSSRKIGPVYIADNSDSSQSVLSVMEWKDSVDKTSYHYQLQLNNIKTTALIKKKEVFHSDKPIEHEQMIGRLGNIFWVLTDSLVGYDASTLETAVTENIIASINPFMKNNFSRLHNSYLLDEAAQVMYMGTENGDRYKLYPDLSIKPDNTSSDPAPDDFNYEFAAEYKVNDRYELKYALSCIDTAGEKLFIIGSKTETGQVLDYFGVSIFPERDEMRQVTIIPYKQDGEKIDYKNNKPFTGSKQYFKGGFLQKKFTAAAWHNSLGERVILYYSNSTATPTLCIALIDKEGKEKWTVNSGIAANCFADYLLTAAGLQIWFNNYKVKTNQLQNNLLCIDLLTGNSSNYIYLP